VKRDELVGDQHQPEREEREALEGRGHRAG
jgi:hypothetical protein